MKVGLFINTQFPEGVNLAERASPLANDAERRNPGGGTGVSLARTIRIGEIRGEE
jgi:hypothetical protein